MCVLSDSYMTTNVSAYWGIVYHVPATPIQIGSALPIPLGRKRVHNADEIIARIVAERLVDHLLLKLPLIDGSAPAPVRGREDN